MDCGIYLWDTYIEVTYSMCHNHRNFKNTFLSLHTHTMTERNTGIKSGYSKEEWEASDFPILCENCLGDNPYVRMIKKRFGKACKICDRPFDVFRWRPSGSRYKSTEICQTCAKIKNVCQCCVFDLQYGLPVQVRDQFLAQGGHDAEPEMQATSDVAREWYNSIRRQEIASGNASHGKMQINKRLLTMARKQPYSKKSRPNICQMFLQGACARGAACPYRHEMPENHQQRTTTAATADATNTTVWVGGMTDAISESDLRKELSKNGKIREVRLLLERKCAFVEFESRDAAKKALESGLVVNDLKMSLNWAKSNSSVKKKNNHHYTHQDDVVEQTTNAVPVSSLVVPTSQPAISYDSVPAIPQAFQAAPSVRKILNAGVSVPPPPPRKM